MNSHAPFPTDDLPVLTDIVSDHSDGIPVLTDVLSAEIPENAAPALANASPAAPTAFAEFSGKIVNENTLLAALQQQLAEHLENVFAQKLARLQQQATAQALAEFNAELPELLRQAVASLEQTE